MITRRLVTAFFVALLISGVFTFWLIQKYGKPRSSNLPQLVYVTAAKDIDAGELLKPESLHATPWPSSNPLPGAFSKPEDIVGRTVMYRLAEGQPILDRQVSPAGVSAGLSAKIPDGMRAVSLKSDQVVGVAGFLLPGTHIDVLVTFRSPSLSEAITSTVLQDTEILAAGQKTQPDPEGKATTVDVVTILVTPEDGEKVVLASTQGTVHFVLRNGGDHAKVNDAPTQMSSLGVVAGTKPSFISPSPRTATELPKDLSRYTMQVTRGDKQSNEVVQ